MQLEISKELEYPPAMLKAVKELSEIYIHTSQIVKE